MPADPTAVVTAFVEEMAAGGASVRLARSRADRAGYDSLAWRSELVDVTLSDDGTGTVLNR